MTDSSKRPPASSSIPPLPRKPSGKHEIRAFRQKFESINEHTLPQLYALNEKLDRKLAEAHRDPRREPSDDPRQDDEIPVDVVTLPPESDPFPSEPPKKGKP